MKIRKLKIKNYKVFDDVEFDFTDKDGNTLDTVVLAGVNGTGKTTVLEFIFDCINQVPEEVQKDVESKFNTQKDVEFELNIAIPNYNPIIKTFNILPSTNNSLIEVVQTKKETLINFRRTDGPRSEGRQRRRAAGGQ